MTYHSLSSGKFNSPFKTFPDALTNCHCCKGYFKEGHASKLKINHHIWIMPGHFFTENSLHFFVVNLNLLWSIDHWILIILNFDAIHPKCAFFLWVCASRNKQSTGKSHQGRNSELIPKSHYALMLSQWQYAIWAFFSLFFALGVLIHMFSADNKCSLRRCKGSTID